MAKLGEVCLLKAGKFVSANDISPEYNKGLYPCFGGNGIRGYVADYTHDGEFPLIGRQGALCGNVNLASGKFHATEHAVVVQPKIEMNVHWLYYALNAMNLGQYATGAAQPGLAVSKLETLSIEIPNISEQNKIAQTLYKVEQLVNFRKQQLAKLDELVKARFVEMFGDDIYPKVKVSRVCDFITKGTTPPNNLISEKYSSDKVPYLKVYNLSFTGKLLFDTAPQYVPENIHNGVLARSKVYPNDVLMNIVGPPLGKFALVTDEFSEWNINQAIAIFRAKEKVNPKYLLFALMQPEVLKPFLRQAVGIRQLNLSLAQCRDLEIPLPPLSLQSEFAAFVERVDQQKQTVQQSLEKLELMKKALMQEYFG